MVERRGQQRKFLISFVRVLDRHNGQLVGYLSDLTTGGAMLIGDKELEPKTILHLRIDLPENFPRRVLDLEVRVVWCQPDEDPDTYRTGLQLLKMTPIEMSLLGRLLSEFGLHG